MNLGKKTLGDSLKQPAFIRFSFNPANMRKVLNKNYPGLVQVRVKK